MQIVEMRLALVLGGGRTLLLEDVQPLNALLEMVTTVPSKPLTDTAPPGCARARSIQTCRRARKP